MNENNNGSNFNENDEEKKSPGTVRYENNETDADNETVSLFVNARKKDQALDPKSYAMSNVSNNTPASAPQPIPQQSYQAMPQPAQSNTPVVTQKRPAKSGLTIGLIIGVVVLGIVVLAFAALLVIGLMSDSGSDSNSTAPANKIEEKSNETTKKATTKATTKTNEDKTTDNAKTKTTDAPKTKPAAPKNDAVTKDQEMKTFSDANYPFSFTYPASMRVDKMNNNTVQLTNKLNNTFFIRCEKKFLTDSLNQGMSYEEAAKSFGKLYMDNLIKNANNTLSNYEDGSVTTSDGAGAFICYFNTQNSSGYWKVKLTVVTMNENILVTAVWSDDAGHENAVNEFEAVMKTLAIGN